jgi:hypothetical protein
VLTVNEPAVGAGGYANETEDPAGAAAITNVEQQMSATALAPRNHPAIRFDILRKRQYRNIQREVNERRELNLGED